MVRIIRLESKEQPRRDAWEKALRAFDPAAATVLKREGKSDVLRTELLGLSVIIKRREQAGLADRLKWICGKSRHHRQWAGATWLLSHGFGAARPLALAKRGKEEWLVIEEVEGRSLLQVIADRDLSVMEEHKLAHDVGRHLSTLRKSGRYNRDHKPSNLIVARRLAGAKLSWAPKDNRCNGFSIAIIDSVAIRRSKDAPLRMLHALAVEPLGLGILPRRSLLARVVKSIVDEDFKVAGSLDPDVVRLAKKAARATYWKLVSESLQRHGDPTPRTNPLASPSALSVHPTSDTPR